MENPNPHPSSPYDPPLVDEQGPIPRFGPAKLDEFGRLIHPTPEELAARRAAWERLVKLREKEPIDEPEGLDEEIMRAIDSHRPEGCKLFEGYY